jgi:O-antigen/teichoic acid export membrane protein
MRRYPGSSGVSSETAPVSDGTFNDYLRLSLPLFFIGLGYQLLNQMDTLMLGHFTSEKEVGLYSVALKVSAFVVLGLDILLPIVSPLFSQFRETNDQDSMKSLFETVTKWLFYSALVIFACLVIFRVEVLGIFGKGFKAAATVLLILSVGQLTNAAAGPTGALLTMTGKQKWEVGNTVSMLVFNFVLNLLLIPKLGMIGGAIATALTIATINGLKLVQVYMLFGLRAHNSKYIKGVAAITLGGVIAYGARAWLQNLGLNPYLIISFGGLAFLITALGALWIMGLDEEDKVALLALRRRRASQSCQAVEC